jgi:hypothetical protein
MRREKVWIAGLPSNQDYLRFRKINNVERNINRAPVRAPESYNLFYNRLLILYPTYSSYHV